MDTFLRYGVRRGFIKVSNSGKMSYDIRKLLQDPRGRARLKQNIRKALHLERS